MGPQRPLEGGRTLHGCQAHVPGVKGGDNCLWAAPAEVLAEVVLHVAARLDAYLPPPSPAGRPPSVLNVSGCGEKLLRSYPEAVLLCGMREVRVLGCALNCSRCHHSPAPCGHHNPYCTKGGPCRVGCCFHG